MDYYLFNLFKSISTGNIKVNEIANALNLSPKQTVRYLKKWEIEGWLTFTSGRGRGNVSSLNWMKNVEEEYEVHLLKMIEEEPVEKSSKYLLLDWTFDRKQRLMEKFRSKFGYIHNTNDIDKLVIPRRYRFMSLHPLKAADAHSANLVATIYNRLVSIDETGVVLPEIAHSWDVSFSNIRLYLKKDVRFHDGSILTANDVVYCLQRMRSNSQYIDLWEPVGDIKAVAPLVIDIHIPKGCSYIIQLLGTVNASIYKETESGIFGTNSFQVVENNNLKTTLKVFKEYFAERPMLDVIEFIQVPHDYDIVYSSNSKSKTDTTIPVVSNSGFGVVILNKSRNTDIQRKEVRDYIHSVIAKHRHEIGNVNKRACPTNSCLTWQDHQHVMIDIKRPTFDQPLIIMSVNKNDKMTIWLKNILQQAGVPVEIKYVSFEDALHSKVKEKEVDLFIHGEIFEMNESFSFYYFLVYGYSPIAHLLKSNDRLKSYLNDYIQTPFVDWKELHSKVESKLIEESLMIPLYTEKREIPFSTDIMNINIKHFGYVDFSKLWVKPEI